MIQPSQMIEGDCCEMESYGSWSPTCMAQLHHTEKEEDSGHRIFIILLHADKNKLTMSGIIFITVSRTEPLVFFVSFVC